MKKIISLTIASIFILSFLSACTQEPPETTTQNVTSSITTLSLEDSLSAISAAKAEKHEVQIAVSTVLASAGLNTITVQVNQWDGSMNKVKCGTYDAGYYLKTPIKGTYSISFNGDVTCTSYPGLTSHYLPLINR
jgi:hypothetical protein